ncbi:MAG: DUF2797 domain-containing protein [Bdellovibrionales bacterium]
MAKLFKMKSIYADPIRYFFHTSVAETEISSNLGKKIEIRFSGKINCVHCDRSIKKTFSGGYCFPCSQDLAEADMCIVRPETCHHHLGTCRDDSFAQKNCFIPHVIYVADSSALKVGITRSHNTLKRWVDQGATKAIAFWQVEQRKDAGEVEVFLKQFIGDKTNWRNMLKGVNAEEDIEFKRDELLEQCEAADLPGEPFDADELVEINFPVDQYPDKISSLNLDKTPVVSGVLEGIKGQYFLLDTGVINIRKYAGYDVELYIDGEKI